MVKLQPMNIVSYSLRVPGLQWHVPIKMGLELSSCSENFMDYQLVIDNSLMISINQ